MDTHLSDLWWEGGISLFLKAHFSSSCHCSNFADVFPAANKQLNFSLTPITLLSFSLLLFLCGSAKITESVV